MNHPNLLETAFNPWSPALYNFMLNVTLVRKVMILKGEMPLRMIPKGEMILYGSAASR